MLISDKKIINLSKVELPIINDPQKAEKTVFDSFFRKLFRIRIVNAASANQAIFKNFPYEIISASFFSIQDVDTRASEDQSAWIISISADSRSLSITTPEKKVTVDIILDVLYC